MANEDIYRWESNGGCERCDAIPIQHRGYEPTRPHPNCSCGVIKIPTGTGKCHNAEPRYELDYSGDHNGSDVFRVAFDFKVTCRDGTLIEGSFSLEQEYADWTEANYDNAEAEMLDQALTIVESHAASECPSCTEPLFV